MKIWDTYIILDESDVNLIEQEINYKKINEILMRIFINNEKYTEKDKNILLQFFEKDKIYIIQFIKLLNVHKSKGKFILSENNWKYLGELFKFKNILILSKMIWNYLNIYLYCLWHIIINQNKRSS